jgi:hypothetical protein|tara:strand:+ start:24 stop:1205 length:1182 start_codon:yes stop_codon:yes gene_type:complete
MAELDARFKACDDEYASGCAKAYSDLMYDSVEECKEDYGCDTLDNTPETVRTCPTYMHEFESIPEFECSELVGWSQSPYGDCWLDTILYIMFGTKIFPIFNNILEGASQVPDTSSTIILLRNYLTGLYNPDYSREPTIVSNCKYRDKWNLFMSDNGILNLMEKSGQERWRLEVEMTINHDEEIISYGTVKIIIDFIIILNNILYDNDRKLKYVLGESNGVNINGFVADSIENNLLTLDGNSCLILHRVNIQPEDRRIVIRDIIDYNSFKLKCIIVGDGIHFYGFFTCDGTTWYEYNNSGMNTITDIEPYTRDPYSPRVKILDDINKIDEIRPEEIILFYESPAPGIAEQIHYGLNKAKSRMGGYRKRKSKGKKQRKSKKNTKRRKRRRRTERK